MHTAAISYLSTITPTAFAPTFPPAPHHQHHTYLVALPGWDTSFTRLGGGSLALYRPRLACLASSSHSSSLSYTLERSSSLRWRITCHCTGKGESVQCQGKCAALLGQPLNSAASHTLTWAKPRATTISATFCFSSALSGIVSTLPKASSRSPAPPVAGPSSPGTWQA